MPKNRPANDTNALIRKARSIQPGPDLYSNFQRVTVSPAELTIDFYAIGPNLNAPDDNQVTHLQRVIIPLIAAADFARIIHETTQNVSVSVAAHHPDAPVVVISQEQKNHD